MTAAGSSALAEAAAGLVATAQEARDLAARLPPGSPAWSSACAIAAEAQGEAAEALTWAGLPAAFAVEIEGRA